MSSQIRQQTGPSSNRCESQSSQDLPQYWTDDLPVCHLSGVGFSTNQIYRQDGLRVEEHPFEDSSFHFRQDSQQGSVFLYGVLDGHDGSRVSSFASQRMPAEILLDELDDCHSDEQIKQILRQAFESVEKGFLESIGGALANVLQQRPEGTVAFEAIEPTAAGFKTCSEAEAEIIGGTTAVVAFIVDNKLFVANAGCCRALLCKTDSEGVLRVSQLTADHDLDNEAEQQRLAALGLDVDQLKEAGGISQLNYTRSIGDYAVKDGYRFAEPLRSAISSAVIAEPELRGGVQLDSTGSFLLLMSAGLYRSLAQATGTAHVNADIASLVAGQFAVQSTLHGVAQAAVDQVVRMHHDRFTLGTDSCARRDDITLLVRNFGYRPLSGFSGSPSGFSGSPSAVAPLSVVIPPSDPLPLPPQIVFVDERTLSSGYGDTFGGPEGDGAGDSPGVGGKRAPGGPTQTAVDGVEQRVEAYVDFAEFYGAMAALTCGEHDTVTTQLEVRPTYEAIPEDREVPPFSAPSTPVSG